MTNDDLDSDLKESRRMFNKCENIIKECLSKLINVSLDDVYIHSAEAHKTEEDKYLDLICGIDYVVKKKDTDEELFAISWRATKCKLSVFPDGGVYNAFSLRRKRNKENSTEENCELNKLLTNIRSGSKHPEYMAQVNYDKENNDDLLSLGVAKIEDILDAHSRKFYRRTDPKHVETKHVFMEDVAWQLMDWHGYNIVCWYKNGTCVPTTWLDTKKLEYINIGTYPANAS